MNYEHLKYFVVAAQTEHIIKASEKLNITQSTLSRAIYKMEEELDVKLFEKVGRNVKLTQAGQIFLQYSMQAIEMVNIGTEQIQMLKAGIRGELKINSIYAYSYKEFPGLLKGFMTLYPDISCANYQLPSKQVLDNVLEGTADIGFCSDYFDFDAEYPQLNHETVYTEEVVLVCSDEHRFSKWNLVHLADIADENFISFTPLSGFIHFVKKIFDEYGLAVIPTYYATDDFTLCRFAASGLGVGLVGKDIAEVVSKTTSELRIVRLADSVPMRRIYMIWPKNKKLPAVTSKFIQFVRNSLGKDAEPMGMLQNETL